MAGPASDRTARLSVIDRLIDTAPSLAADPPVTMDESVRQMKRSVLRDLEWLLNTRRTPEPAPDQYPEVQQSVYNFGVPDISSLSADSPASRDKLLRHIEESIRLFEPRLTAVKVTPAEKSGTANREIRFVVDALLRMEPNPDRIVFDTVLTTSSGEFRVNSIADA
jgi:type VI secretion system protein ImpF